MIAVRVAVIAGSVVGLAAARLALERQEASHDAWK